MGFIIWRPGRATDAAGVFIGALHLRQGFFRIGFAALDTGSTTTPDTRGQFGLRPVQNFRPFGGAVIKTPFIDALMVIFPATRAVATIILPACFRISRAVLA